MRRLTNLWNWLPAFRAVAQTEHVRAASKQLHVSPSALSRTIRLIEEDVGQPLFNRVGRSLELNATGAKLLSAVRDSMRLIDEALGAMASKQFVGPVRVSSIEPYTSRYVLPALARLTAQHPELIPHLSSHASLEHNTLLLRGQIDVALAIDPRPHSEVTTARLKELACGVYVGSGHPLHGVSASLEEILEHPFIAPEVEDGVPRDGWPSHLRRKIGMHADLALVPEVVRSGRLIGVLPVEIAAAYTSLWRLPPIDVKPITLFASIRKSLGFEGRAELVMQAVTNELCADLPG